MEKEYNENDIDWNAIEGDFMGFLEKRDIESCDTIIDNLAEQKEFSKALELCMKRCAAIMKDRMTLPSDYGKELGSGGMTDRHSPNVGVITADYGEEKNLRTLDEQIDAISKWDSPAERNYKEGLRRQREFGVKPVEDLIF